MAENNPAPPDPCNEDLTEVFSPRSGLKVLDWYAQLAGTGDDSSSSARHKPLFMTFAFGMHKDFQKVYEQKDGVLRFALMEKEGNGRGLAQGIQDITRIRKLPNVVVTVGHNITVNRFDRWLKERATISKEVNVRWIHTKYLLVDPLGEHPVVVSGSANFSEASTNANNENMLVIRNEPRVADIYWSEFMRLYAHHAFRESVARGQQQGASEKWQPNYLVPNSSWQADYFKPGDQRFLRHQYFAGLDSGL